MSLTGPAAIPLNQWTHLAATFDGATKVLFVNGIPVASQGGLGALAYVPAPVGIGATWTVQRPRRPVHRLHQRSQPVRPRAQP